jgi:hypothetical protein
MKRVARHTLVCTLALLLAGCGGSVASDATKDGGAGQDSALSGLPGDDASPGVGDGGVLPAEAGLCEGTPHGGVPSTHRATATTCPRSSDVAVDAAVTCTTNADCVFDGSLPYEDNCVHGVCGGDQCLVDSDCPGAQVCVCGGAGFHGDGPQLNVCVPAACKVDGDCGTGRYCVPSVSYCGSTQGFNCTSPTDTCVDPHTDCSCGGDTCDYAPQVGHFVCATAVCNG